MLQKNFSLLILILSTYSFLRAEHVIHFINANLPHKRYQRELKENNRDFVGKCYYHLEELGYFVEELLPEEFTNILKESPNAYLPGGKYANVVCIASKEYPIFIEKENLFECIPKNKRLLIHYESNVVNPKQYQDSSYDQKFDLIMTYNDDLVDNIKYFKFFYPEFLPLISDRPSFQDKKFSSIIFANKSFTGEGNQALLRRAIVRFYEKFHPQLLDFYGMGWPKNISYCYRGEISEDPNQQWMGKIQVMKNYKFAFCIENSNHLKGYITEKLLNAFTAGVIPVYAGPLNSSDFIPKECFINIHDFQSLTKLNEYLMSIDEKRYNEYVEAIERFLNSDQGYKFTPQYFAKSFDEMLRKKGLISS